MSIKLPDADSGKKPGKIIAKPGKPIMGGNLLGGIQKNINRMSLNDCIEILNEKISKINTSFDRTFANHPYFKKKSIFKKIFKSEDELDDLSDDIEEFLERDDIDDLFEDIEAVLEYIDDKYDRDYEDYVNEKSNNLYEFWNDGVDFDF